MDASDAKDAGGGGTWGQVWVQGAFGNIFSILEHVDASDAKDAGCGRVGSGADAGGGTWDL